MKLQAEIKEREREGGWGREMAGHAEKHEMEMAHEKEMAMIHKEAAAAGKKGSVNECNGIPKVIRSHPQPCLIKTQLICSLSKRFLNGTCLEI